MNVMILAAGAGKRMGALSGVIPKPLLPALDKRLLDICVDTAMGCAPDRIVINVCHLADKMEEFIQNRDFGVEVIISREPEMLGTGGGIKRAQGWLGDGDFAVINPDVITRPGWGRLGDLHRGCGALATLMLRDNRAGAGYSVLNIGDEGNITRFGSATCPGGVGVGGALMFTGVSILSPGIFDKIPAGRPVDISGEIYGPMTERGERGLYGVRVDTQWTDAGTVEKYHSMVMNMLMERGGMCVKPPDLDKSVVTRAPVYIEDGARISAGAAIGPCVAIHGGAQIGVGACLERCVVMPGAVVEDGAVLAGKVVSCSV